MAIYKANVLKNILLLVIVVIAVLGLSQSAVFAEGVKLSAVTARGDVGGRVTVTINAENAAGSEGGQFLLTFDPGLVRPVSAEAGELVENASSSLHMANLEYGPGQLIVLWVTPYADTANSGVIGKITFELLKAGETALNFSEIVIAPDGIEAAAAVSGKITASRSATTTQPAGDSRPAVPEPEADEPAEDDEELGNGQEDAEQIIEDTDQVIDETGNSDNFAVYAIVLVVLVFLVTIGLVVIKKFKKPVVK